MEETQWTRRQRILAIAGILGIMAAAIVVRASVEFGTTLMPKTNGAYYLVQVRALLTEGHLAEHDMPLTFWLQAGLALFIRALSSQTLEASILLASKLFDSIIPAVAAIPAFLLAVRWPGSRHSVWAGLAAAALAVLSSGPLTMIGDFQKNAFGMVLVLGCAYYLQQALAHRSRRALIGVGVFLALTGITHIGAFGVALALTAAVAVLWALSLGRKWRSLLVIGGLGAGGAGLLGLLALLGDSARIQRLLNLLRNPLSLFQANGMGGRTGGGPGSLRLGLTLQNPQIVLLSAALAAAALAVLIGRRRTVQPWERSLVLAAAILALFLSSPFLNQDMSSRLELMAFAPGVLLVSFLFARLQIAPVRYGMVACVLAVLLIAVPSTVRSGSSSSIAENSYTELASLKSSISDPSHTLVIARHGLEWWAAWALHTNVAQATAVTSADWKTYTSVLYLQEKGSVGEQALGPGLSGAPGAAAPGQGSSQPQTGTPPVQPGRPSGNLPAQPDLSSDSRPMRQGSMGGGFSLPSDAVTVYSGTYYTLSRLPTAITVQQGPGGSL